MLPSSPQPDEHMLESDRFYILLDYRTQLPVLELMRDPEDGQDRYCLFVFADPELITKIDNGRYKDANRFCAGELISPLLNSFLIKVQENQHVALLAVEHEGEVRLQRLTRIFAAAKV